MTERYPDDATLLALSRDEATGVEYIPTGLSPYHVAFRRLLQRTLLSLQRANDLRVFRDGDLSVGVRAGRCVIRNTPHHFPGVASLPIDPDSETFLWLDHEGELQSDGDGLPTDRSAFLPLAVVTSDAVTITAIEDLRGEAFLHVPDLASLGVTATVERVNAALTGTEPSVSAAALNALTAGITSTADIHHRHLESRQHEPGEAYFILSNTSDHADASIALVLSLPELLPDDLTLAPDKTHGFLTQRYNGVTLTPVAVLHTQFTHAGVLTASLTDQLMGACPIDGTVTHAILSVGSNIQSSNGADHIAAALRVNGTALCTTNPAMASSAGAGFRSTARGQGTPAVIKSDGTQHVQRGDLFTLDLTRTIAGSVTTEAGDIAVLLIIRAASPV